MGAVKDQLDQLNVDSNFDDSSLSRPLCGRLARSLPCAQCTCKSFYHVCQTQLRSCVIPNLLADLTMVAISPFRFSSKLFNMSTTLRLRSPTRLLLQAYIYVEMGVLSTWNNWRNTTELNTMHLSQDKTFCTFLDLDHSMAMLLQFRIDAS